MLNRRKIFPGLILSALLLIAILLNLLPGSAAGSTLEFLEIEASQQIIYVAESGNTVPRYFAPPRSLSPEAPTATIQVTYVGSWPSEAQSAFNYAVHIWESQLVSSVPIAVEAGWASLGPGVLGSAGPTRILANFSNAPYPNTYYPAALANKLAGTDLNTSQVDINATFNSSFGSWYFGTNGQPGLSQWDFVSVVLHEIGHGLGFIGSMVVSGEQGFWGSNGLPWIYDRFAETGSGTALLSYSSGSASLADVLTSGSIYFDGPYANAANSGQRVELYAPSTWSSGSSYSHLDNSFDDDVNGLMTYSLLNGESYHSPGPVTLGLFRDIGWGTQTAPPLATPTVTPIASPASRNFASFALKNLAFPGIYGTITQNGIPAAFRTVMLRKYDASINSWSTAATTTTRGDGGYTFNSIPSLDSGDIYYAAFSNSSQQPGLLWFWATPYQRSFSAGTSLNLGIFDIADVVLNSPANGSTTGFPATFTWTRRSATASDSYRFHLYEPSGGLPEYTSAPLGYTSQIILGGIPPGFLFSHDYAWDLYVIPPNGGVPDMGWGWSLGVNRIQFRQPALVSEGLPSLYTQDGIPVDPLMLRPTP